MVPVLILVTHAERRLVGREDSGELIIKITSAASEGYTVTLVTVLRSIEMRRYEEVLAGLIGIIKQLIESALSGLFNKQ